VKVGFCFRELYYRKLPEHKFLNDSHSFQFKLMKFAFILLYLYSIADIICM
jgi:hypothetical protein